MQWLLLVGFVVVFVVFFVWIVWPGHVRRKRQLDRARNLFSDRTSFSSADFASSFFRDVPDNVPIRLRRLLERELGFDLACLRPDDRLAADLGLGKVDGLQPFHFAHDVEEEFAISFPEHAWKDIQTCSDLVTYVAKQTESHSSGSQDRI